MCYRLLESSPKNANVRRGRKEIPHAKERPDLKEYQFAGYYNNNIINNSRQKELTGYVHFRP